MQKEKATNFNDLPNDYWNFVCDHLPDYYKRGDVLTSNTLIKYISGEEVELEDLEWLPDSKDAANAMMQGIDLNLYNEAVDAYNEKMKSYHYRLHIFREDVLEKLMDALNGQHINVSRYDVSVSVRNLYTSEVQIDKLTTLECTRFKTENNEESIPYSQMDIADLCAILDNLTIGEWKHLVVKRINRHLLAKIETL